MSITVIRGVADIADAYDGFILDLWGVLYDGGQAYPWVLDTLHKLGESGAAPERIAIDRPCDRSRESALNLEDGADSPGRRIAAGDATQPGSALVVLSNGPRRAAAVADRLAAAGIARTDYDGLMSSGEEAWQYLAGVRPDPWYAALGHRCLYIGTESDRAMLDGLDITEAAGIEEADFILAIGPRALGDTVADYEALLAAGAARDVPMVCANPDLLVHRLGREEICAGALAQRYEALGGDVRWHGKPYASVYESSITLLGPLDRTRILVVGDSFRTDIKGANGVGLDSLLVAGGIHQDELCGGDGRPDAARIDAAARSAGAIPTFACGRFEW